MRLKNFFNKFTFVIVGVLIALIILEIIFRNYSIAQMRGFFRVLRGERLTDCQVNDAVLNHRFVPNCKGKLTTSDFSYDFETNSLGLREREIPEKKDGVYRILIIGDSFAEGWGVPLNERFDRVASNIINNDKIEIVNAGIRSYSPILELLYLKDQGLKLNPDKVIMLFDASDLHDDTYYGGWPLHQKIKDELGFGDKSYVDVWPVPFEPWFYKSKFLSNIYLLTESKILDSKKEISTVNLGSDISLFGYGENWNNYERSYNLNIANISLIRDFLKSKNIDFNLTVVPRGIYVGENEWDNAREILGLRKNRIYEPKMFDILKPDIDLLTPLKLAEKDYQNKLFYSMDGHWTKVAHEIVGKVIADFIVKSSQ